MRNAATETIDLQDRHINRVFHQYEADAVAFVNTHLDGYPELTGPIIDGLLFYFLTAPKNLALAAWNMTAQANIHVDGTQHQLRYALLDGLDKLQYAERGFGELRSEVSQEDDSLIAEPFFELQAQSIGPEDFLQEADKQAMPVGALLRLARQVVFDHPDHPQLSLASRSPDEPYPHIQIAMSQLPYQIVRHLVQLPHLWLNGPIEHGPQGSTLRLLTTRHRFVVSVNQTLFHERLAQLRARLG